MSVSPTEVELIQLNSVSLVELLSNSGVISAAELEEAHELSASLNQPIDKALVMCGYTSAGVLLSSARLQLLLKDNSISNELSLKAIKICHDSGRDLMNVLAELGWKMPSDEEGNKLGNLLVSAGVIDNRTLERAICISSETGYPLGRSLILLKKVTKALLWSVLNAQILLREGAISRQQAALAIAEAYRSQMPLEQILHERGVEQQKSMRKMRLGELLKQAGFLSEENLMNALEVGFLNKQPIGQVLIDRGFIGNRVIERALQVQKLVDEDQITPEQSGEALRFIVEKRTSVAKAILELGFLKKTDGEKLRIGELLKMAAIVKEEDVVEALRLSEKNSTLLGKMLLITGKVDAATLQNALECQTYIRTGALLEGQGVIALNYCQRMRCPISQAVIDLGWRDNMEMRKKRFQETLKTLASQLT